MDAIALSQNGVPIRLPDERWAHIAKRHEDLNNKQPEVLATVSNPVRILSGDESELLALRELEPGKWLVVVYRELVNDGFIITAYSTRRLSCLNQRQHVMALVTIQDVQQYLERSKIVKALPKAPFSLVYDAEADVMYIDFGLHPKSADDSELTDDDVIR